MPRPFVSRGLAMSPVAGTPRVPTAGTHRLGWRAGLGLSLVALIGGTTLGLALTSAAIRHGGEIGTATAGSWRLSPQEGTPNINPYQRAAFARSATIPMSAGQGAALIAIRDDGGRKLDLRCTYTVSGSVPRARFWTLGAVDATGFAMTNAAERYAFTSEDVLRDGSGAFSIVLSPEAQPGNWLPIRGEGRFSLVLRLYDSVIPGLANRELGTLSVPTIVADRCR